MQTAAQFFARKFPAKAKKGFPFLPGQNRAEAGILYFYSAVLRRLDQLDNGHLGGIAATGTDPDDAGVAAIAVGILRADLVDQLLGNILFE